MDRMHGWVGRKDRRPIATDAVVRRADGTELNVRLADLSDEGCRIESEPEPLRIGEWIEIVVSSSGSVKAQVRWALGTSAGAKFDAGEEA
ncbi:MAG TPA: PilZ domain-containing protein [Sphingomicrobium sp.]|nr:PilZ domain-containing protein [Sphingomicrobium sp.]